MLHIVIIWIILPMLMIALTFTFIRLLKGPHLADRVVARDFMSAIAIATIAAYSILSGRTVLLDIGLVVSLLSFLGTIAFGYYLEYSK